MLGLDWQAMLVWMAAGQSYPCLLLYAHCVYCARAPASTKHCNVLHCELILPNIGHCLQVLSSAIHLATIRQDIALQGDPSSQKLNFVL